MTMVFQTVPPPVVIEQCDDSVAWYVEFGMGALVFLAAVLLLLIIMDILRWW